MLPTNPQASGMQMGTFVGNDSIAAPFDPATALANIYTSPTDAHSPPLTAWHVDLLAMASRSAACASLLATLGVICVFMRWRRFRTPANRLIFFMAAADFMSALSLFAGRWALPSEDTVYAPACVIQAFMQQWGDLASIAWTAAMSINLILVLFMTRSARDLDTLEKYYFFGCFGVAFCMAFVPMFLRTDERGFAYGPALLRCQLTYKWPELQLGLYYAPVWAIFLMNVCVYIASGVRIVKRTWNLPPPPPSPATTNNNAARPLTFHQQHSNNNLAKQRALSALSVTTTATSIADKDRSRTVSSFFHPGAIYDRVRNSFLSDHSVDYEGSNRQRPASYSAVSVVPSQSGSSVANETSQALLSFRSRYFQKIILFLFAYVLVWSTPTVARIYAWLYPDESGLFSARYTDDKFPYYLAMEIAMGLRGFINFVCYFLLSWWNIHREQQKESQKLHEIDLQSSGPIGHIQPTNNLHVFEP